MFFYLINDINDLIINGVANTSIKVVNKIPAIQINNIIKYLFVINLKSIVFLLNNALIIFNENAKAYITKNIKMNILIIWWGNIYINDNKQPFNL